MSSSARKKIQVALLLYESNVIEARATSPDVHLIALDYPLASLGECDAALPVLVRDGENLKIRQNKFPFRVQLVENGIRQNQDDLE